MAGGASFSGIATRNGRNSGGEGRIRRVRFEEDDIPARRWSWTWRSPFRRKRAQQQADEAAAKHQVARAPWVPRYAARDALISMPPQHPDDVVMQQRRRTFDEIGFTPLDTTSDSHDDPTSMSYRSRRSRSAAAVPPANPGLPVAAAAAAPPKTLKQDSVVREDAVAETLRLLTASASERGMSEEPSSRSPWRYGQRPGGLYSYGGAGLFQSHGMSVNLTASK